jgi:undecaprenyl-diphosphatase
MSLLQAVILGIVQGLTEFLPVSSDGHLVLMDQLLGSALVGRDALGFDILLHAGSVVAILIAYFSIWKSLIADAFAGKKDAWMLLLFIAIATIPGVFAGLFLEDMVSGMRSYMAAGIGFIVTGCVLMLGEWIGKKRIETDADLHHVGYRRAFLIGCAQAVAILPGVSRSGSTISIARALGLHRKTALDFSFLMALPIISGAVAKTMLDAFNGEVLFPALSICIAGFTAALIMSIAAIALLKLLIARGSIAIFAWYAIPLGCVAILIDTLA